jgi:CheY-like chemotaxis protein
MDNSLKVLLVDDDPDLLEMYRAVLQQLPSRPEIHSASSGSRALAMLESEPYRLLLCDLKMPKVDGLQVLSVVRRKYPQVRTVALTSMADEQFRARAYALGVDLFWQKPATEQEIRMFLECVESLLAQGSEEGFRGIQSKSLVDLIQLECLSQNSLVLRINNGPQTARIWIQDGDVIDAEADDFTGEEAFLRILSWRGGTFETLPADPGHQRQILKPYNALLLESAQALDEMRGSVEASPEATAGHSPFITNASRIEGLEFVLASNSDHPTPKVTWGLENPKAMAEWAQVNLELFRALGERLSAGNLERIDALGSERNLSLTPTGDTNLCVGWNASMSGGEIAESMKKVAILWDS